MQHRTLHVRIPATLDGHLTAFCESNHQSVSAVVRAALAYMLARPALYPELCARPVPTVFEEIRSPEQIRAYAEYEKAMEDFDMNPLLRESGLA